MKLKDIELSLAVKDGVIDLDLKAPGVKAVVTMDREVYQAWARPAPAEDCGDETPVDKGLGTSPSLTMGEVALLVGRLGQGLHEIHEQRKAADEGDEDDGEQRAAPPATPAPAAE